MNYSKNGVIKNGISYKAVKANKKLADFLPEKESEKEEKD